ncbi:hypothetical protein GYA49_02865 [Candidatus Beckwithbacteria bacterium]|nr:hypothetical protein [Candidatus Beckwithbacteria bacterium]
MKDMQYKGDFILRNIVMFLWVFMRYIFVFVSFNQIVTIGDWNFDKSLVLVSIFNVSHSLYKMFFEENFMNFASKLYEGELDQILLKPISAQFTVSIQDFMPRGFIRFLLSLVIFIVSLACVGWSFSLVKILGFIVAFILGFSFSYSIHFIVVCLSFWFGNVDNIHFLSRSFTNLTYIPMDIFPLGMNLFFTLFMPIVFIATVPAKILFEPNIGILVLEAIISILFFWLTSLVWHQGLKSYSSVSS